MGGSVIEAVSLARKAREFGRIRWVGRSIKADYAGLLTGVGGVIIMGLD